MYSPKRVKLNLPNGGRKRDDFSAEENRDELYPQSAVGKNGVSPYFLGKPRRKIVDKSKSPPNAAGPPPPFKLKHQKDRRSLEKESDDPDLEKITIEEEEDDDIIVTSPKQEVRKPSIRSFFGEKSNLKSDEVLKFGIKSEDIRPSSSFSTKGFDFGTDEKVVKIRDKLCDIVDPLGARREDPGFVRQMHENTLKGIEVASNPCFKRKKYVWKNLFWTIHLAVVP